MRQQPAEELCQLALCNQCAAVGGEARAWRLRQFCALVLGTDDIAMSDRLMHASHGSRCFYRSLCQKASISASAQQIAVFYTVACSATTAWRAPVMQTMDSPHAAYLALVEKVCNMADNGCE